MTEEDIKELKADIEKKASEGLNEYIGLPFTTAVSAEIRSFLLQTLRDIELQHWTPIVNLLDFDVEMDGNMAKFQIRPKTGLSNNEYHRAQCFILGLPFVGY